MLVVSWCNLFYNVKIRYIIYFVFGSVKFQAVAMLTMFTFACIPCQKWYR